MYDCLPGGVQMKIGDNAPVFLHTDLDKWKPCLMEQKVE